MNKPKMVIQSESLNKLIANLEAERDEAYRRIELLLKCRGLCELCKAEARKLLAKTTK